MFERFTERAIKVVMLAQEEARRLGHNFVGTEQLFCGMLGERQGVAYKALHRSGVNLHDARVEVEKIIGRGSGFTAVEIPFTPRAKRVLELAWESARQLQHNYIGTEHLLLGLVQEGNGVAARVWEKLGANAQTIERDVHDLLFLTGATGSSQDKGPNPDKDPQRIDNVKKLIEDIKDQMPKKGDWKNFEGSACHVWSGKEIIIKNHRDHLPTEIKGSIQLFDCQVVLEEGANIDQMILTNCVMMQTPPKEEEEEEEEVSDSEEDISTLKEFINLWREECDNTSKLSAQLQYANSELLKKHPVLQQVYGKELAQKGFEEISAQRENFLVMIGHLIDEAELYKRALVDLRADMPTSTGEEFIDKVIEDGDKIRAKAIDASIGNDEADD